MGYKDRTFRLDLSELGEGCWVDVLNPVLRPKRVVMLPQPGEGDSQEEYLNDLLRIQKENLAEIIVAWNVWDVEDQKLPLPKDDPSVMDRVPAIVLDLINARLEEKVAPFTALRMRRAAGTTSESSSPSSPSSTEPGSTSPTSETVELTTV